jgi:sulfur carrier protein
MNILINQQPWQLPEHATVADAVAAHGASGPFAVAVNLCFVPRPQYASTPLREGDQIDIIAPVTGG